MRFYSLTLKLSLATLSARYCKNLIVLYVLSNCNFVLGASVFYEIFFVPTHI